MVGDVYGDALSADYKGDFNADYAGAPSSSAHVTNVDCRDQLYDFCCHCM